MSDNIAKFKVGDLVRIVPDTHTSFDKYFLHIGKYAYIMHVYPKLFNSDISYDVEIINPNTGKFLIYLERELELAQFITTSKNIFDVGDRVRLKKACNSEVLIPGEVYIVDTTINDSHVRVKNNGLSSVPVCWLEKVASPIIYDEADIWCDSDLQSWKKSWIEYIHEEDNMVDVHKLEFLDGYDKNNLLEAEKQVSRDKNYEQVQKAKNVLYELINRRDKVQGQIKYLQNELKCINTGLKKFKK